MLKFERKVCHIAENSYFCTRIKAASPLHASKHPMKIHDMTLKRFLTAVLLTLALLTPVLAQPLANKSAKNEDSERSQLINHAMKYIGSRYRHGTSGPHTFDCSGFTSFVYRQKDIKLSRSAVIQWTQGTEIKEMADLKPGDLIFFQGRCMTKRVGHVGLVKEVNPEKGDVSFIHAACSGVRVDKLSMDYYRKRFIGFRRVL